MSTSFCPGPAIPKNEHFSLFVLCSLRFGKRNFLAYRQGGRRHFFTLRSRFDGDCSRPNANGRGGQIDHPPVFILHSSYSRELDDLAGPAQVPAYILHAVLVSILAEIPDHYILLVQGHPLENIEDFLLLCLQLWRNNHVQTPPCNFPAGLLYLGSRPAPVGPWASCIQL